MYQFIQQVNEGVNTLGFAHPWIDFSVLYHFLSVGSWLSLHDDGIHSMSLYLR